MANPKRFPLPQIPSIINDNPQSRIPPALQALYVADDKGAYALNGQWEDVAGLKSAYAKAKAELDQARAKIAAFGNLTPDQVRERMRVAEERIAKGPRSIEEQRAELEAQQKAELEAANAELVKATQERDAIAKQHRDLVVEREALSAVTAARGAVDLLMPHLRKLIITERLDDGSVVARVLGADGQVRQGVTVKDLIEEWRGSETFGKAFERPALRAINGTYRNGNVVSLTRSQALDVSTYRAARDRARAIGVPLVILDEEEQ